MSKNNKPRGKGRNAVPDNFGPPLGAPRGRNASGPQITAPSAPSGAWATAQNTTGPFAARREQQIPVQVSAVPTGAWAVGRNVATETKQPSTAPIASTSGQPRQSAATSAAPTGAWASIASAWGQPHQSNAAKQQTTRAAPSPLTSAPKNPVLQSKEVQKKTDMEANGNTLVFFYFPTCDKTCSRLFLFRQTN